MRFGIVVFTAFLFLPPAHAQNDENAVGFLQAVEGGVVIVKSSGAVEQGSEGHAIFEGDKIQVQSQSKACVSFDDDNTVDIGADSELEIKEYGLDREEDHVLLKLWRGAVDLLVKKKYDGVKSTFNLQTRSAVMGVRGTEYTVEYSESNDDTVLSVSQGEVEMGREIRNHRIVEPERVNKGFEGRLQSGMLRAKIAKFNPKKLQELRTRLKAKLSARHEKLKRQWKARRRHIMKNRRKFRQQLMENRKRQLHRRRRI